jgi:hypothetical protein
MCVDVSTVSVMVTSAGVLIAATYYIKNIRHQTKLRQTDLVLRLYNTYGSPEFQKASLKMRDMDLADYEDYLKKYQSDVESKTSWLSVAAFFEGIGVLVHKKLIDISLVDDLFSTPVIAAWEKIEHLVESERKHRRRPQIWEWFEYLYKEMKKTEQRK